MTRRSLLALICFSAGGGAWAAESDHASEILDKAEQHFRGIADYECVIEYECRLPDRVENKNYRIWYKQPGLLRVRVVKGSGKGSEVALDEEGQFRGRQGGLLKPIVVRLKPTDKRLQGLRGKNVAQFNLGSVFQSCRGRCTQRGAEMKAARPADDATGTRGIVLSYDEDGKRIQETYRFDPATWFLSSCAITEDGKLVESFNVSQLKVDAGLSDNWFRL